MKKSSTSLVDLNNSANELSKELTKKHSDFVSSYVLTSAANYALKNLPTNKDSSIYPFVEPILSFYKGLVQTITLFLKSSIQNSLGEIEIEAANSKYKQLLQRIQAIDALILNCQTDISRKAITFSDKANRKWSWMIYLIGLGEAIFISNVFISLFLDNYIFGFIIGVTVSLAYVILIKHFVLELRDSEQDNKTKSIIALIIFVVIGAINIGLAFLRYNFLKLTAEDNTIVAMISPYTFLAIQLILTGATAYLSYFYAPSKKERLVQEEVDALHKKVKALEQEHAKLITERDTLVSLLEFDLKYREECKHIEATLIKQVMQHCKYAHGRFKEENVLRRSDLIFPNCFKEEIVIDFEVAPIILNTKSNSHENK